jgi:hypothetical protein
MVKRINANKRRIMLSFYRTWAKRLKKSNSKMRGSIRHDFRTRQPLRKFKTWRRNPAKWDYKGWDDGSRRVRFRRNSVRAGGKRGAHKRVTMRFV